MGPLFPVHATILLLEFVLLIMALLFTGEMVKGVVVFVKTIDDWKFARTFSVKPKREGETNTPEMVFAVRQKLMRERQKLLGINSSLFELRLSEGLGYKVEKKREALLKGEVKVIKKLQDLFNLAEKCLGKHALAELSADLRLEELLTDPRPKNKPTRHWFFLSRPAVSRRKV